MVMKKNIFKILFIRKLNSQKLVYLITTSALFHSQQLIISIFDVIIHCIRPHAENWLIIIFVSKIKISHESTYIYHSIEKNIPDC